MPKVEWRILLWQCCIGLAVGGVAFASTRGQDGSLTTLFAGLFGVGALYLTLALYRRFAWWEHLLSLVLFELCALPALLSATELDGMAGALLIYIPVSIGLVVFLVSFIAALWHRLYRYLCGVDVPRS